MKFVFIRHSKTERNPQVSITCWGLSDKGIELAKALSQKDIIKKCSVIYSSFQTKALETAVLLTKPNAIPIKVDDRLTEDTSFTGPFEMDGERYINDIHNYYTNKIDRIKGGETKSEALTRFNFALKEIAKVENKNEYIGIISHGNILTLFSAQYKNIDCLVLHDQIKQPDVALFDYNKKTFLTFFGELSL